MATILERNKDMKPKKKTMQEHAQDALYREVWEDVNNEKTQQFLKKYSKHLIVGVVIIMIAVVSIQIGIRSYRASKIATAESYETAVRSGDINALVGLSKNTSGATSDLALFQAYMSDKDVKKLEDLAANGKTRDFRDLAKIHLIGIRGDEMSGADVEKYLADLTTKSSPYYYTACLTIAQKYLATGERETANKWLDKIINDSDAPAVIVADAQNLR